MQKQIAENCQARVNFNVRMNNKSNLSNKTIDAVLDYLANSKKGGLARLNKAVRQARSARARHAINARWMQKRELRRMGDFAAYREACLGNVSQISPRALRPPEDRQALDSCSEEEATAA
jgi:hypothetical protein